MADAETSRPCWVKLTAATTAIWSLSQDAAAQELWKQSTQILAPNQALWGMPFARLVAGRHSIRFRLHCTAFSSEPLTLKLCLCISKFSCKPADSDKIGYLCHSERWALYGALMRRHLPEAGLRLTHPFGSARRAESMSSGDCGGAPKHRSKSCIWE